MATHRDLDTLAPDWWPTSLDEQVEEQREFVERFCEKFGVTLLRAFLTTDPDEPGPIYQFDDCLGGYNITGIRLSLEDSEEEGDYLCTTR